MAYRAYILNSSKAIVAALADATWTYTETLNARDTITLESAEADKFSTITAAKSFVRLVDDQTSTDTRTYRLHTIAQIHQDDRIGIHAEGDRIWQDMAREVYAGYHPYRGASVAAIVTDILTHSQFQIKSGGSAESDTTEVDDLDLSYLSCLEALQRIAEAAGLEIEIDETTSPESIDLKTRGADNGVQLQAGGNATGITRREKRDQIINKVYAVGGGDPPATCLGARFEVKSYVGGLLTVDGDKCVPANDAFNTTYYAYMVTGANAGLHYQITDCARGATAGTDTLTLAGAPAGIAAGDLFKFVDVGVAEIDFVPNLVSQSTYGTFDCTVHDTSIEAVTSLVEPSFMDGTYAAGVAEGWSNTGAATLTEETDATYIQHGTASQKVVAAGAGQGITQTVSGLTGTEYSLAVRLYVTSGKVEVKVTGPNGELYINGTGTTGVGWDTVTLGKLPIGGASAGLWIRSTGGAATFYVDAVAFTDSAQPAQTFVRYNGARALYRLAFDMLDRQQAPVTEYEVQGALDLYRADPKKYPFHAMEIGDTVALVDPDLSLATSVRVLSITRNQDREVLGLTLSTRTDQAAAFDTFAPALGQIIKLKREAQQTAEDTKSVQQAARDALDQIAHAIPSATRGRPFDGTITSTGQVSVNISAGTLTIGDREAFTIGSTDITSLTADTVYYLYFDKGAAASSIQATTSIGTATAANCIFITMLVTGATALDRVRIYQADQQVDGEIWTRGVEVYDDLDAKRLDIGDLADLASAQNPSDWGLALTEGVIWQNNPSAAAWTSAGIGTWRYLKAEHDLVTDTTSQLYADWVDIKAKSTTILMGRYTKVYATGSGGAATGGLYWAISDAGSSDGLNVTAYGVSAASVSKGITIAVDNTGAAAVYGVHVASAASSAGNAYGILIEDAISAGGTGYAIYSSATEASHFVGAVFGIRGIAYTWPVADGGASEILSTDGAGNLSWTAVGSGTVTGSGTTNYVAKWSAASVLTDSIIYDSGSAIGIGTASPNTTLDIYGGAPSQRLQSSYAAGGGSGYTYFLMAHTSTTNFAIYNVNTTNYGLGAWCTAGNRGIVSIEVSPNASAFEIGTVTSFPVHIRTNSTRAITIDTSQKVGIGTTSPTQNLHIDSATSPTAVRISCSATDGIASLRLANDAREWNLRVNTTDFFNIRDNTAGVTRLVIDTAGKVGIVNTSPTYTLDVTGNLRVTAATGIGGTPGTGGAMFYAESSAASSYCSYIYQGHATLGAGLLVTVNGTADIQIAQFNNSSGMVLVVNASNYVHVANTLGVGTSPSYTIHANAATNTEIACASSTTSWSEFPRISIRKNGTPVDDSTLIGALKFWGKDKSANNQEYGTVICTTTNTTHGTELAQLVMQAGSAAGLTGYVQVDGAGDVSGTHGSYHVSSDARHKNRITTIDNALAILRELRGVYYFWNTPKAGRLGRQIGLIAQEVEPWVPEVVYTREDGYKALYKDDMVALCINGIKELDAKTETHEQRIVRLEAENAAMRAEVALLKAA